jgi:hypothetical protein
MAKQQTTAHIRERALNDFKQQLALEKFQEERPQLWLQAQRIGKLIKIQNRLDNETFPEGSCFLHAATVSFSSFCVKKAWISIPARSASRSMEMSIWRLGSWSCRSRRSNGSAFRRRRFPPESISRASPVVRSPKVLR